jgi:hypothetical protein
MPKIGYIEYEPEDFISGSKLSALEAGYDLEVKNERNITNTLADVISQISSKYDIWNMSFRIEVIVDNSLLFYFYRYINVYDQNLNPNHQLYDFTPYYGEEENDVGKGKISIEINLSAEFAESLIFMSSYEEEKLLKPIEDLLKRTDIIVNFDVSGGRIYLAVPIEVEVVKYII